MVSFYYIKLSWKKKNNLKKKEYSKIAKKNNFMQKKNNF